MLFIFNRFKIVLEKRSLLMNHRLFLKTLFFSSFSYFFTLKIIFFVFIEPTDLFAQVKTPALVNFYLQTLKISKNSKTNDFSENRVWISTKIISKHCSRLENLSNQTFQDFAFSRKITVKYDVLSSAQNHFSGTIIHHYYFQIRNDTQSSARRANCENNSPGVLTPITQHLAWGAKRQSTNYYRPSPIILAAFTRPFCEKKMFTVLFPNTKHLYCFVVHVVPRT